MEHDEVRGRFIPATGPERYPYDVVVDGRRLSWEELGRALESYEGFQFRLLIEEQTTDEWKPPVGQELRLPRLGEER